MSSIKLKRKTDSGKSTIGVLTVFGSAVWVLEDPRREHKVHGETRIPAGRYKLALRNEGGMTQRYAKRFPKMHKGMIWLLDVPMFEWVYLHIGNYPEDTEGCLLVGLTKGQDMVLASKAAYQKVYPLIAEAIEAGDCWINIEDEDV